MDVYLMIHRKLSFSFSFLISIFFYKRHKKKKSLNVINMVQKEITINQKF